MATRTTYEIKNGNAVTTDAGTQTPVVTFDLSTAAPGGGAFNNCTIFVNGNAVGWDAVNGHSCGERVAAQFQIAAGVLTQVSTTAHVTGMISSISGAPNSSFSVSGTTITYYVTGSGSITINWWGRIDLTIYQPT